MEKKIKYTGFQREKKNDKLCYWKMWFLYLSLLILPGVKNTGLYIVILKWLRSCPKIVLAWTPSDSLPLETNMVLTRVFFIQQEMTEVPATIQVQGELSNWEQWSHGLWGPPPPDLRGSLSSSETLWGDARVPNTF